MKTILAYGDSLTWGMDARTGGRHAAADLWPAVLGARLGPDVSVINAGLNGRTTMFDDYAVAADRNGVRTLPTVLATFEPIDVVIFMLGTNDLKTFTAGSAVAAAQGIKRLIEIARSSAYTAQKAPPEIVVVSPPEVLALAPSADFPLLSPRTSEWAQLADAYERVARAAGVTFFNAAKVATAQGGVDGVHLDVANTRAIGEALAPVVAQIIGAKIKVVA